MGADMGGESGSTQQVGLKEAALLLGISTAAMRKRLLRGSVQGIKDEHGTWLIDVASLTTAADTSGPASPDPDRDALVTALRQENQRLWQELQAERASQEQERESRAEEMRRKDIMLAEFARQLADINRRLPALPEATPVREEQPTRSWWQRLFGTA